MEKIERLRRKKYVKILIQSRSDRDPDPKRRLMWGDHWVKAELDREFRHLGFSVVEKDPDVILQLFGSPAKVPPPPHTYNMVWFYSHPDLITPDNLRAYDRIFCSSPDFIPRLETIGYGNVDTMLPSTSKRPVTCPMRYDIIFLGNARTRRSDGRAIVGDMGQTHHDFKVWGNLWEHILPPKYYGGHYWDYRRLENLYAASRITLTDHHPDMAREGFVSNKVFDILASGGFVISDNNPGIEKIFGDTVPRYESAEHLKHLVDFYLGHPGERERLMLRGRDIALAHTYRARALQFTRDILP